MATLPARVRDYEIWGRLGEGGMSEVWLAKHGVLAVPVVIKTIKPVAIGSSPRSDGGTEELAARVIDEARLMARIASPRVVRAIDAGVHEGVPYLVEEYVDGLDMAELDRRRRASLGVGLPLWFVAATMTQACQGLHAAHQAGVLHCDVKPSNLFGSLDAGVRLGDFGIAVRAADRRRQMGGTLRFMSPEQLTDGSSSRRSDVWGAAATACDLRYGSPPFDSLQALLDPDAPPRLPAPRSSVEAFFQHQLRGMLAKRPEQRCADAGEAARQFATLARALDGASRLEMHVVDRATLRLGGCTVVLRLGDIADAQAEAIVSSAGSTLAMRTGSADALRRRGGDEIEREARAGGDRPLGACVVTSAGRLAARHVLHAVSAWNEASCIGRALQRALLLTDELGHTSIAAPALGTGVARVTIETCATAMMGALRAHLLLGGTRLKQLEVVLDGEDKLRVFREVAEEALRDQGAPRGVADLGLAVDTPIVRAEGATFLDPESGPARS